MSKEARYQDHEYKDYEYSIKKKNRVAKMKKRKNGLRKFNKHDGDEGYKK